MATLADVLRDPPKPHRDAGGQQFLMGLLPAPLTFITEHVAGASATLETGCGISTVAFALTGARHWTITPAGAEFKIVQDYCRARGIATEQLTLVEAFSEMALPSLRVPPLDLVLIDGRHGFPAPFIDWYYTAAQLKCGGYLIVDDTWLWSCQMLRDFLLAQPQWAFVTEYEQRTAVFKKLADGAESAEWIDQPLVARGGRAKWIDGRLQVDAPARLTARAIAGKVARRLGWR